MYLQYQYYTLSLESTHLTCCTAEKLSLPFLMLSCIHRGKPLFWKNCLACFHNSGWSSFMSPCSWSWHFPYEPSVWHNVVEFSSGCLLTVCHSMGAALTKREGVELWNDFNSSETGREWVESFTQLWAVLALLFMVSKPSRVTNWEMRSFPSALPSKASALVIFPFVGMWHFGFIPSAWCSSGWDARVPPALHHPLPATGTRSRPGHGSLLVAIAPRQPRCSSNTRENHGEHCAKAARPRKLPRFQ